MKIDFYDLFSLHTPKDFPESGGEQYITAAISSRVMENISADKRKHVRMNRLGRTVLATTAAVVVLIMGTLAASALGIIDFEKIFGGMFKSGTEHLEGITAVPQNVVTTGDDRLSLKVLGIGGTENEAFGVIEIKRNDGGTFPEYIRTVGVGSILTPSVAMATSKIISTEAVDETTAKVSFRMSLTDDYKDNYSIIGSSCEFYIEAIEDVTDIGDFSEEMIDGRKVKREDVVSGKNIVLTGSWTIAFPLEYEVEQRSVGVNLPFRNVDYGIWSSEITEINYSAVSLDIVLDNIVNYGRTAAIRDISVKLDSGKEFTVSYSFCTWFDKEENKNITHYSFDDPIDIDSVESITIGDTVISVK